MMMAPYAHPLHMKVDKHLAHVCLTRMCDPLWVGLKPHCLLIGKVCSPAASSGPGFLLISQIRASSCSDNAMMTALYAHPLHMQVDKHLAYV